MDVIRVNVEILKVSVSPKSGATWLFVDLCDAEFGETYLVKSKRSPDHYKVGQVVSVPQDKLQVPSEKKD
jgi:hypothetical protein